MTPTIDLAQAQRRWDEAADEIAELRSEVENLGTELIIWKNKATRFEGEWEWAEERCRKLQKRIDALPTDQDAEIQWMTLEIERLQGIVADAAFAPGNATLRAENIRLKAIIDKQLY